MMNSAKRNEYEQLSSELPACFRSFIHDRLVGLTLDLTLSWFVRRFLVESTLTVNDDFMCISKLVFQPLEEVPIVLFS